MALFKEMGKALMKLFKYTVLGIIGLTVYIGLPILTGELMGPDFAVWVLCIESIALIAFAIYWSKKHPAPVKEKVEQEELGTGRKIVAGIFFVFIVISVIASSEDANSPSASATTETSTVNDDFNPADYFTDSTQKTFYTNDTANIRSCESVTCPVIGQSDKNMPISLNYVSPTEMPEWVSVGFSQGGVAKEGFMHKSVFSNTVTASPTYYGSYSGSNYHTDSRYKYNSRTGYSGDYTYDYSIEGYGDTGYAYGDVEMNGKYGEGYIYNEDGEEVYVETEWTDNGVMEAYDEYGNWYEFEVY